MGKFVDLIAIDPESSSSAEVEYELEMIASFNTGAQS